MAKKISGKLLSVILVLAICCSTVFGCLITVSAEDNSWLSFGTGKANNDFTQAEIELTVNPADIIDNLVAYDMGGIFSAFVYLEYDNKALSLSGATFVSGTDINDQVSSDGGCDIVGDTVKFMANAKDDTVYFKQVNIKLTFNILSEDVDNGQKYTVTATGATVGGTFDDSEYDTTISASGTIVVGCAHEIEGVGAPIADTVNGYEVYTDSKCKFCEEPFGPQAIPTKLPSKTIYWSGEKADALADTDADGDGTYIIKTAEELAYVVSAGPEYTSGKNFKIADGIEKIVLQPESFASDILALSNVDRVKDYFTSTDGLCSWTKQTFVAYNSNHFCGNFDGNGVEIYGLYANDGRSYAALFPNADGNITIENVAVKNSYIVNTGNASGVGWRVGGIIANVATSGQGLKLASKLMQLNKCTVANSYFSTTGTDESEIGVLAANLTSTAVWVTDCLVYGCQAYAGDSHRVAIIGQTNNNILVSDLSVDIPEEYQSSSLVRNMVRNSIIMDVAPYHYSSTRSSRRNDPNTFQNVHTNMPTENVVFGSATYTYESSQINQISPDAAMGTAATSLTGLDFENVWEVDANGGYPVFKQTAEHNIADTSEFGLRMLATNLTYNTNGSYNINFYYRPSQTGGNDYNPLLYVTQLSEDGKYLGSFNELEGDVLNADEAAAVDGLKEGDIRYTIDRLSAREIYNKMVATAIVVKEEDGDNAAIWGESTDLSIADYAQKVLDGEGYYGENSEQYKTADQNLAQAVLKYGEAAYTALNTSSSTEGDTIYWDGDRVNFDTVLEQKDGVYIINNAEELAYVVTAGADDTYGKTFKIADGISNIVLQKKEHDNGIMQLNSHSEVRDYFENTNGQNNSKTSWVTNINPNDTPDDYVFAGTFDGNGATIWGMSALNGESLFGTIGMGATIKNLSVKNSYATSGWYVCIVSSRVIGFTLSNGTSVSSGTATFENIEIANCQGVAKTGVKSVYNGCIALLNGTISGTASLAVKNILVYGNEIYYLRNNQVYTQLVGGTVNNAGTYLKDSVILDCSATYYKGDTYGNDDGTLSAEGTVGYRFNQSNNVVSNVYSNFALDSGSNKVTVLENSDMAKGMDAMTNMPGLDWENTWCYTSGYPTFVTPKYVASKKIIYWDGTTGGETGATLADNDEAGTEDSPIIIDTAEELAVITGGAGTAYDNGFSGPNYTGYYYALNDNIDKIILQPRDVIDTQKILTMTDANEIKTYLTDLVTNHGGVTWSKDDDETVFNGHFDGKGVEIYGMYSVNVKNAGLFDTVDGGGAIAKEKDTNWYYNTVTTTDGKTTYSNKNYIADYTNDADCTTITGITLKNSYLQSKSSGTTRIGGIVASSYSNGYGAKVDGTVKINNCGVINCYLGGYNIGTSGILYGGNGGRDRTEIKDCIVYGNQAYNIGTDGNATTTPLHLTGNFGDYKTEYKTQDITNSSGETETINVYGGGTLINSYITNVISLGAAPFSSNYNIQYNRSCYQIVYNNVYSDFEDLADGKIKTSSDDKAPVSATNLVYVADLNDLIGANAKDIVKTLNGDATTPVWYVGNGTYPGFREAGDMIAGAQIAYDSIIITDDCADNYGTTTDDNLAIYATSLNLKTNPYLAFTFVFNSEYITTRNKIEITFKTASGTYTTTPPEYVAGQYINKVWDTDGNGNWTNNKGAGRYHLYRFENIPVGDISSPIEITITYDGKTMVDGASLSLQGFAYECANAYKQTASDYYDALLEATKSLILYSQMVQARYGAKSS